MNFEYCAKCGEKLSLKTIGDEGLVPFCKNCNRPWFSFSYPCVICLAVDQNKNVALIKQSYGDNDRYVCVAGYVKQGETIENAAIREIKEEIGLDVCNIKYVKSYHYEKRDNLMFGFVCHVESTDFTLSCEVDKATWFTPAEADEKLRISLIAHQLLNDCVENDYI